MTLRNDTNAIMCPDIHVCDAFELRSIYGFVE